MSEILSKLFNKTFKNIYIYIYILNQKILTHFTFSNFLDFNLSQIKNVNF